MSRQDATHDRKKFAILGALGLGLAIAARRRHWQHHAFSQMPQGGGPGGGGPFDATLRAWHEQAHGQPAAGSNQPGGPTQL